MNGTILLADDSLTIQKVVELTFADTGHEVVSVSSGDDLLARLPSVQPDIVICDVLMPGTDGYSVCQTIKSDPKWLHIPVVLLTGTFEPFDRDRAIAAGCDEIITKPFEARKLVETVERLLGQGEGAPGEQTAPDMEPFEGAMAPPPEPSFTPATPEQYETALAEPQAQPAGSATDAGSEGELLPASEAEELDFTTSGFDEMRRAGEQDQAFPEAIPDEGLEFDTGSSGEPTAVGEPFEPAAPPEEPSGEPFSEPPAGAEAAPAAPEPEDAFEFGSPGTAGGGHPDDAFPTPVRTPTLPMEVPEELRAKPPADEAGGEAATGAAEPFTPAAQAAPFEESATAPAEEPPAPPEPAGEPGNAFDSPSTEPVIAPGEPQAAPETATSAEESAAPAAAAGPAESPSATGLSDEDVERIARRVVELAADRLEQIAWEILPDMAELVVRERIRQLEAEVEQEDATN